MKPQFGSIIADKIKMAAIMDQNDVTKHFKMMMFFNSVSECMSIIQRCSVSKRVFSSCNNGSPVRTSVQAELQFTSLCRNGALK